MTKLLLIFFVFCSSATFAQPGHAPHNRGDRSEQLSPEQDAKRFARIKAARQAYIAEELELTPAESEAFFPVYWDYEKRLKERKDSNPFHGRLGSNTTELTEKEARAKLLQRRATRQQILTLSLEAEDQFLKIIPANKVIRLPEIERAFRKKLWDRTRKRKGK